MKKRLSLQTVVGAYGSSLGVFALLCPHGEMLQGVLFQVVVLLLASEVWHFLWIVPSVFLMFKEAKSKNKAARFDRVAKLTSPVLLVVPPLIYGIILFLDTLLCPRQFSDLCGFSNLVDLFIASYASVTCLFITALLFPVIPFSFTEFAETAEDVASSDTESGLEDIPINEAGGQQDVNISSITQRHSVFYKRNLLALQTLLRKDEKLLYATAPDVALVFKRTKKTTVGMGVGTVFLVAGLSGLFGFFVSQETSMKFFCALLTCLGVLMSFLAFRAYEQEKKRWQSCDYFLTSDRFCRINCVDRPKCIFWKDKPNISVSRIPGTEIGNVHISPTSGIISTILTKFGGMPVTQKSETQNDLDGMVYVHDCTQIFNMVKELNSRR